MKPTEVHSMADDQLVQHIDESRKNAFGLKFQHATGQLENTAGLRTAKRDVARALTVARQRGIDVERELRRQRDE